MIIKMIKKIIYKIISTVNGDTECPAYWWEQGYEDCDEGCYINYRVECYKCKYSIYPNFLIKRKVDLMLKKEEECWQKEGQKVIDMEALQTTHNKDCAVTVAEQPSPKPAKADF